MPTEPDVKRTIAFVDGQNLFHAARRNFGSTHPDYDARMLAQAVVAPMGWQLVETRFYTGVHAAKHNLYWHTFWSNKLKAMRRHPDVSTCDIDLRYVRQPTLDDDGVWRKRLIAREKGIDVRIAIDAVRLAREQRYDVAVIFSQDQDFTPLADEIRAIARDQNRWIKIASAYPKKESEFQRGIDRTDWIAINEHIYSSCRDPRDYVVKALSKH